MVSREYENGRLRLRVASREELKDIIADIDSVWEKLWITMPILQP